MVVLDLCPISNCGYFPVENGKTGNEAWGFRPFRWQVFQQPILPCTIAEHRCSGQSATLLDYSLGAPSNNHVNIDLDPPFLWAAGFRYHHIMSSMSIARSALVMAALATYAAADECDVEIAAGVMEVDIPFIQVSACMTLARLACCSSLQETTCIHIVIAHKMSVVLCSASQDSKHKGSTRDRVAGGANATLHGDASVGPGGATFSGKGFASLSGSAIEPVFKNGGFTISFW
jgi:hypothetical protein